MIVQIESDKTELTINEIKFEFDLGYKNFTLKYLTSDPLLPEELSSGLSIIELYVKDFISECHVDHVDEIYTSGITRNIAAVFDGILSLKEINNYEMSTSDLEEIFRVLATESNSQRLENPGLTSDINEYIVGACCILVEICRQLTVARLFVS